MKQQLRSPQSGPFRWWPTSLLGITMFGVFALSGCRTPGNDGKFVRVGDWRERLAAHRMAPGQNIHKIDICRNADASHHLVRIREREPYHIHAKHDLTVFVLAGRGEIVIDGKRHPCGPGHVLYIPRGLPHAYINRGRDPGVAYAIFNPPFGGEDIIPVGE